MARSTCLVRYSAKEALQKILEQNDSASGDDDSGTDYEDHASEESEHSDVETVEGANVEEGKFTRSTTYRRNQR